MTLLDFDNFDRTTVNALWTRYPVGPLTEVDRSDPFIWYENGTYYLICDDLAVGDFKIATSTDGGYSFGSFTTLLSQGGAGAWDERRLRDPFVVKVDGTYYLYYTGQTDTSPTGLTHKIGVATSSTIDGTYTKDAGNPIVTRAGEGVNEPCVTYDAEDSPTWRMTTTNGAGGDEDDVGFADIGYWTSSDGLSWTDQGDVITGNIWQDQEHFKPPGAACYYDYLNKSDKKIYAHAHCDWSTSTGPAANQLMLDLGTEDFDGQACYAPTFVRGPDGIWRMYYAGQSTSTLKHSIGLATSLTPHYWTHLNTASWACDGDLIHNTGGSGWELLNRGVLFSPPYRISCKIKIVTPGAGYGGGVRLADDGTLFYACLFSDATNTISLWNGSSVFASTTSYAFTTGVEYDFVATVTKKQIVVDFNGNSGVIVRSTDISDVAWTLGDAAIGFYNWNDDADYRFNDWRVETYDPEDHTQVIPGW